MTYDLCATLGKLAISVNITTDDCRSAREMARHRNSSIGRQTRMAFTTQFGTQ